MSQLIAAAGGHRAVTGRAYVGSHTSMRWCDRRLNGIVYSVDDENFVYPAPAAKSPRISITQDIQGRERGISPPGRVWGGQVPARSRRTFSIVVEHRPTDRVPEELLAVLARRASSPRRADARG
jgi:hypothetical protein